MTTIATLEPLAVFVVVGRPAAQGSKRHVGGGRLVEQSKAVQPWRDAVKLAAVTDPLVDEPGELTRPYLGPLRVGVVFTVPKPVSAPKTRRTFPAKRPDLDKMLRSTLDALTDAGVWRDDGQIVDLSGRKVYPREYQDDHPDSLSVPGAVIRVWSVTP